jgi:hypothetical protein
LEELDMEIIDNKGSDNVVANHLSRMHHGDDGMELIEDRMRDDHLYRILDRGGWMHDFIKDAYERCHWTTWTKMIKEG